MSNDLNNSPDFSHSTASRTIPENTAVGDPVGAVVMVDINEDHDTLTYELVEINENGTAATGELVGEPHNTAVDTEDVEFFSIDKDTGQIRVAKALSAEETDDRTYEDVGGAAIREAGVYKVVVRATDPSGEPNNENRGDIVVTITATDVNEAPRIVAGNAELEVNEKDSSDDDFIRRLGL